MKKNSDRNAELRRHRKRLDARKQKHSTDDAPHYFSWKHPQQLFEIDYPAHWKLSVDKKDGSISITHPSMDPLLGMDIFRMQLQVDTQIIQDSGHWEEIATGMFESTGTGKNVRHDPTIIYPNYTADRPEEGQGGRRWFMLANDLILCASTNFPDGQQQIWEPIFDRVLSSLRVHREDHQLAVRLMSKVKQHVAELRPNEPMESAGLTLKFGNAEVSIGNLLHVVKRNPESMDALVEEFCQGIFSAVHRKTKLGQEPWEEVRTCILPLIKSDQDIEQQNGAVMQTPPDGERHPLSDLVSTSWLVDLRICYAIDGEHTFRLINHYDLQRWNIDVDELHSVAIENLSHGPRPDLIGGAIGGERMPGFAMLQPHNGVASSYVLLPDFFQFLSPHLGREIQVAIPSRDALVIFSGGDHDRSRILAAVQEDYKTTDRPLSDRLFAVTPDGIALA